MSRREELLGALRDQPGFVAAQTLHARMRADDSRIGLATVYRLLAALEAEGTVDAVRAEAGETLYRLCGTDDHHHHLICRDCGRAVDLDSDAVERWAHAVAREQGFTAVEHTIEITGVCAGCRAGGRTAG